MTDKDDLKFDIEEKEFSSDEAMAGGGSDPNQADGSDQPIEPRNKGASQRLLVLLILLLLVVVGAAAWVYFSGTQAPAPPPLAGGVAPTQSKTLPVPARESAGETPAQAPTASVPAAEQPAPPTAVEEKPTPSALAEKGSEAAPHAETPAPVAAAKEPPAESATPSPAPASAAASREPAAIATSPDITAASEPAPAAASVAAPPAGRFTVQVGAFATPPVIAETQAKIRSLGHEPRLRQIQTKGQLVRLRVGTFFPSQGEAKMGEIRLQGGEPFFLMDGDLMVVYAGSFQSAERAAQLAQRLQAVGIHVAEERVGAQVSLTLVRFGDFLTRAEAEQAAAAARAKGMEAQIIRLR
ncbi:SPOR domain-containing protein [Geoalkalibacter sp.]|uniref:SPOR domain-containing protein n=1 Tax=Geoalkalibacter sp. TaxID=3041440 RepID=UPI00272E1A17|nr:SPOR domain-containing protein [Geoalkalibacter sp.]